MTQENEQMVQLLLRHGAKIEGSDNGESLFHAATRNGDLEIVKRLVERDADIDVPDKLQLSPLLLAIKYNHSDVVEYLLSECSYLDAVDLNSNNALHIAAQQGNCDIANLLLECGVDTNLQNKQCMTPWLLAVACGQYEMADLIESEIDILEVVSEKSLDTNLHLASRQGCIAAIRRLVQSGADVNQKNKRGEAPIHKAIESKRWQVVHYLAHSADCDVNIPGSHEDKTPLYVALTLNNEDACLQRMIQTLVDAGANPDQEVQNQACKSLIQTCLTSVKLTRWMIDAGADLNKVSRHNYTVFHHVASYGNLAMFRMLLEGNLDMKISCFIHGSRTPLQFAMRRGQEEITQALLALGCSVINIKEDELTENEGDEWETIIEQIKWRFNNPLSLGEQTRLVILSSMGAGWVTRRINQLSLPLLLKQYLHWNSFLNAKLNKSNELDVSL